MPILSTVVPISRVPVMRQVALKMGMQIAEHDEEGGQAYIDIEGDVYKSLTVAVKSGAKPIEVIDSIEHYETVRNYPARTEA